MEIGSVSGVLIHFDILYHMLYDTIHISSVVDEKYLNLCFVTVVQTIRLFDVKKVRTSKERKNHHMDFSRRLGTLIDDSDNNGDAVSMVDVESRNSVDSRNDDSDTKENDGSNIADSATSNSVTDIDSGPGVGAVALNTLSSAQGGNKSPMFFPKDRKIVSLASLSSTNGQRDVLSSIGKPGFQWFGGMKKQSVSSSLFPPLVPAPTVVAPLGQPREAPFEQSRTGNVTSGIATVPPTLPTSPATPSSGNEPDYKSILISFYEKHDAGKVSEIKNLLEKYMVRSWSFIEKSKTSCAHAHH